MMSLRNQLLKFFSSRAFQPFFERLHWLALKGMNFGSANSPIHSGEAALLASLKKDFPDHPIVFDVGANLGQYARLLMNKLDSMSPVIHLFEPDKYAYGKLLDKLSDYPNLFLNNCALGDRAGEASLYAAASGAVDASLVKINELDAVAQKVKVTTLDQYCSEKGIEKIDFLKIDTEGFELKVLEGAKSMLRQNKIKRIQLEHGSLNSIAIGASLYKFQQLLPEFDMYHIKQDGPYKIKYAPIQEIYYNSNYYFQLKEF